METWQVLEKAAALIEERGWTRGGFEESTGEVCVLGAIGTVLDMPRHGGGGFDFLELGETPCTQALSEHLRTTVGSGRERVGIVDWRSPDVSAQERVYVWNDSIATDASEVVDTLRRVAQAEWSAA